MEHLDPGMGNIFIISAPSGTGKTTLRKIVCKRIPNLVYSVSYTTRVPRCGEVNNVDYHFISDSEFTRKTIKKEWIECARVHGNSYGTSLIFLKQNLKQGNNIILDIDVKGTESILQKYPDSVSIFIEPPSLKILEERLKNRGTDNILKIKERLANAQFEMSRKYIFKHVIVNCNIEKSANEIIDILKKNIS